MINDINDNERLSLLHKYLNCNQQALNELLTEVYLEQRKNGEKMFQGINLTINELDKEGIASDCVINIYYNRMKPSSLIDETFDFRMVQKFLRFFRKNFKSEINNKESVNITTQQARDFLSFLKNKLLENNDFQQFQLFVAQISTKDVFINFESFFQDNIKTPEDFENFKKILDFFKISFRIPEDFEKYEDFERFFNHSLKKDIENSSRKTLISLGLIQDPKSKTPINLPSKASELSPEEKLKPKEINLQAENLLILFTKWLEKKYPTRKKHYDLIVSFLREDYIDDELNPLASQTIEFLQGTNHYDDITKKLKLFYTSQGKSENTVTSNTTRLRRDSWRKFCENNSKASEYFELLKSLQTRVNETQYADLKSGGDIS